MAQQEEEKKQRDASPYDVIVNNALYKIQNKWGGHSDWLGFKDDSRWMRVGYEDNLAVKWKIEKHPNFKNNHQIYLFETWYNTSYVGFRESDSCMRCNYKDNLKVPFEIVPVQFNAKGKNTFYLMQKWDAKNVNKWVGYKEKDNFLYVDYKRDLRVPFTFHPMSAVCIGIEQYDEVIFDISNGNSNPLPVDDKYKSGISEKTVDEFGLDISTGAKISADGKFLGMGMSTEVSFGLTKSTKTSLEQCVSAERETTFKHVIPPKTRLIVTQKKVTIKFANGKSFPAAAVKISIVEEKL
eukprot:325336_1